MQGGSLAAARRAAESVLHEFRANDFGDVMRSILAYLDGQPSKAVLTPGKSLQRCWMRYPIPWPVAPVVCQWSKTLQVMTRTLAVHGLVALMLEGIARHHHEVRFTCACCIHAGTFCFGSIKHLVRLSRTPDCYQRAHTHLITFILRPEAMAQGCSGVPPSPDASV